MNNTGSKESNAQIVTHEATVHGADVDSIIETYKKGGIEAVNELRSQDPKGKNDHSAIKKNDNRHTGVKKYNEVKSELIKLDKRYKKAFDRAAKTY